MKLQENDAAEKAKRASPAKQAELKANGERDEQEL